ncbi:hypothetical protein ACF1BN_20330 [Streptomyces sp. NPDC014861]|uniref:hypothetical protein n=1 Tax=Streptomyces sp. NPDC014861 TaxID=3364923 RepID=UPI0036FDC1AE
MVLLESIVWSVRALATAALVLGLVKRTADRITSGAPTGPLSTAITFAQMAAVLVFLWVLWLVVPS